MHPHEYTVIGHDRAVIGKRLWMVATWAAPAAALTMAAISALATRLGAPSSIAQALMYPIAATTIYSAGYAAFNKLIWKMPAISKFLGVPNISGKWSCQGMTIGADDNSPIKQELPLAWSSEVTIHQTWDKIRIYTKSPGKSDSESISASLIKKPGVGFVLMYSYRNDPHLTSENLRGHIGYCELMFNENLTQAEGDYFNNKGRVTWGRMTLVKVGTKNAD